MLNNEQHDKNSKLFLIIMFLVCIAVGIMFCAFVNNNIATSMAELNNTTLDTSTWSSETHVIFETLQYNRSIHVLAMLLLGFGFLMVFVRGHGFSSMTATLLATSISIPIYMLLASYFGKGSVLSVESFLWAEFAAASMLIAIGAPLGRYTMNQYIVMSLLFTVIYFVNEWLIIESGYFKGFMDTGGSVLIHAFGAYFGLGVVAFSQHRFGNCEAKSTRVSNQFCLLGSLVLWVFWPSFTSAIVSPERVPLTAINTVLALAGATLATYVFSKLIRGKLDVEDIANAALAGGVAIGSTCDMASPGMSILIGLAAGVLSTFGFSVIAPKVCKLIRGTDTCGVHNLHGMPGILGGLTAIIITGNWGIQLLGILVSVVIAFISGNIVGYIMRAMRKKENLYDDMGEFLGENIAKE